nr:MAG TPA: zinc-ribbon domain protein [Caudoviricetes sp.]
MALITCPECGHSVSDKAAACPHCGYPLGRVERETEQLISELTGVLKAKIDTDTADQGHPLTKEEIRTGSYLVQCPHCSRMTNKYKPLCESCGKKWSDSSGVLSEKTNPSAPHPRDLKQESKSSSGSSLIWGLVLVMSLIVIIAVSSATKKPYSPSKNTASSGSSGKSSYSSNSSSSSYSGSSSKKQDDDDIKAGVYVLAKNCVKNHLKAPSTAKFSEMWECAFQKGEGDIYMMTGYVDSQNSYGAMLQEQWSIMAEVSGDKVSLVMLTIGDQVYFD